MNEEKQQNAQELTEQQLAQAAGAGTGKGFTCPICHSDAGYDLVTRMTINGPMPMMKCRNCSREY